MIKGWAIFLALATLPLFAETAETQAQHAARLAWWREARFGMFIHYGPVTLTGKEISWSRANSNPQCPNHGPTPVAVYDDLYQKFNPTNFSAADWVSVAKNAGMGYIVLTAKHCDGFLLWASRVDAYNITATPFQRDLCAELSQSARKEGLRVGWYFSPMDWRDPDFRTERNEKFIRRMQDEIRELLSGYGKIDVMWFDYDGREAVYDQTNTYALVKKLQPEIIIDNRLDLGLHQGNRLMLNPNADFYTPEQRIGAYDDQTPWETCMTLGTQWSWKPNDKLKSADEVVRILSQCAGGDGNHRRGHHDLPLEQALRLLRLSAAADPLEAGREARLVRIREAQQLLLEVDQRGRRIARRRDPDGLARHLDDALGHAAAGEAEQEQDAPAEGSAGPRRASVSHDIHASNRPGNRQRFRASAGPQSQP